MPPGSAGEQDTLTDNGRPPGRPGWGGTNLEVRQKKHLPLARYTGAIQKSRRTQ